MGLRINTNIASINALRNGATRTEAVNQSLEKLGSGERINKAADDAAGLAISEKFKIPVLLRLTTRVSHQRMLVGLGRFSQKTALANGHFVKDTQKFVTMPPRVLAMKEELLQKNEKIRKFFEKSKIYEDSTFTMEMGRDLSISEAKEWVKNEELMIDYASKFLESPSKEKEKILADHFSYTTKCTNSYFPPEGTIDIGVFEDK